MSCLHRRASTIFGCLLFASLFSSCAFGQTVSSLAPSSIAAGSGGFVLTVLGNNFNSGSVVRVYAAGGAVQNLPTYFVNTGLLMAAVPANDIVNPAGLNIDVADYATQSSSNLVALEVTGTGSTSTGSTSGSSSGSSGAGSSSGSSSGSTAGSGSGSSSGGSSSSGSSAESGSGSTSCYGCYGSASGSSSGSGSSSDSGSASGSGSGSSSGSTSGSGSSGGGVTSPSGSPMLVKVTSPAANQSVSGTVTITATAEQTSQTDGSISSWAIYDGTNLVWVDENPTGSISVPLALSKGAHTLKVVAYDDSFTPSTATVPVSAGASGITTAWHACMYTKSGQQYQAMQISPGQQLTGVLQSQMFTGPNCNPTQWTDQLNDVGQTMTFGAGSSYLYWFIHRADMPNVSAVWTMGNQSSGCVNYSAAPPCN